MPVVPYGLTTYRAKHSLKWDAHLFHLFDDGQCVTSAHIGPPNPIC